MNLGPQDNNELTCLLDTGEMGRPPAGQIGKLLRVRSGLNDSRASCHNLISITGLARRQ